MSNGLLGKTMSEANVDVVAYTIPAGIQFATINIALTNIGEAVATAKVAIATSATPAAADYIEFNLKIPANGGVFERTCQICSPGENIIVYSDVNDLAIRISGLEQALTGA